MVAFFRGFSSEPRPKGVPNGEKTKQITWPTQAQENTLASQETRFDPTRGCRPTRYRHSALLTNRLADSFAHGGTAYRESLPGHIGAALIASHCAAMQRGGMLIKAAYNRVIVALLQPVAAIGHSMETVSTGYIGR